MEFSGEIAKRLALYATMAVVAPGLGACAANGNGSPGTNHNLVECETLQEVLADPNATVEDLEVVDPNGNGSCVQPDGTLLINGGGRG